MCLLKIYLTSGLTSFWQHQMVYKLINIKFYGCTQERLLDILNTKGGAWTNYKYWYQPINPKFFSSIWAQKERQNNLKYSGKSFNYNNFLLGLFHTFRYLTAKDSEHTRAQIYPDPFLVTVCNHNSNSRH